MYLAAHINKEGVNSDLLTALAFDNGAEGIEETDTHFICSFGESVSKQDINHLLIEMLSLRSSEISIVEVENENWMENWKKQFKPVPIGDHFIVKPTWETVEETSKHIIEIDAKMAFGTGTHETTQLVMELLPKRVSDTTSVLDVGCGSGILAIAAHRLGARTIKAFDVDAVAMENCYENIELNGCSEINAFAGDITEVDEKYTIVIANIISKVLIMLKDHLISRIAKDGVLILSGILVTEKEQVLQTFAELDVLEERIKGEWCAFVLKPKNT